MASYLPEKVRINQLPNLTDSNSKQTSPATEQYNCIAWAAGDNTKWWQPTEGVPFYKPYWPPGVPREVTVNAFVTAFNLLGYEVCGTFELEDNYLKVVLYAKDGTPTHMARQLSDGRWASKLGPLQDIEHLNLNDVSGPTYGAPYIFFRKPI
jgi:hypothetical protein